MILEKIKSTEKIVKMIEAENVLVFETDKKYSKEDIAKEVEDLFEVKVEKVRVLIRKNKKIAFVKLNKNFVASDVAAKLGIL